MQIIKNLLAEAYKRIAVEQNWLIEKEYQVHLERCRDFSHGDFASNFAMVLGKAIKIPPRKVAELLVAALPSIPEIAKIEIAGPGFINFYLSEGAYYENLHQILRKKDSYGRAESQMGQKIYIEFVSANPTGPLHVGHGRSAAYSSCLSNLLEAVGHKVHREYYVNDAGRQMRILALSTWLRYLTILKEEVSFPENAYQGDYIIDIANELLKEEGKRYYFSATEFQSLLNEAVNSEEVNKEILIDAYITVAQNILGQDAFAHIQRVTLESILQDIRQDLQEFGVHFNQWFYESELVNLGLLEQGINLLKEHDCVYERDGALWFRAIHFGDEKDRVLIRENGQPTYFASDVAYHLYKYNQDYDQYIDVFGADHHGYIARIQAFLKGLGKDPKKLEILLVQFVSLYRGNQKVSMSTRSGSFITLRELRDEVGNDATRFFYIYRKPEQHLDFDLELAKKQSNDNPVYYIQYAYARICSVWRQLNNGIWNFDEELGKSNFNLLDNTHEKELLRQLSAYPETIEMAANQFAPHLLAHYLYKLAHQFHSYYNNERFLVEDDKMRNARLSLIKGIQHIVGNGLILLGISTPENM